MKSWLGIFSAVATLVVIAAAAVVTVGGCRGNFGRGSAEGEDFLATGKTFSHFTAVQIDPRSEDSAGPQFVVAEDLNGDGLLDLVSAWNQTQPVQVHLQRRNTAGEVAFETITLAGSVPVIAVAGLAVTDFDADGQFDIAVLAKETLLEGPECLASERPDTGLSGLILIYLGPADVARANQALAWDEVPIGISFLQGLGSSNGLPEEGGYTAMAVGDMDLDADMDIVVAWNSSCGENGTDDVLVFTNNGRLSVRDGTWSASLLPDSFPRGTAIKDVALADVDLDGDLDVVATRPDAPTMNVRWFRNPVVDVPDDFHLSNGQWQVGIVGQIATGADLIELDDIDQDGIVDVLVRSSGGGLLQWLKGPEGPTTAPLRAIPWQVFTLAEFPERVPEAIATGDLNFDGQVEVMAAAEGGLVWFDSQQPPTIFDQWDENLIIDDRPSGEDDDDPATTDPGVAPSDVAGSTVMNSILVADLDGDGASDLIVTLDRSGLSGLTNDALVWFRNTRTPPRF